MGFESTTGFAPSGQTANELATADSFYKASVLINNVKVPVYGIEEHDGCMIGYIEAKTGQKYSVEVAISETDDAEAANSVELYADGDEVGGKIHDRGGSFVALISGRRTGRVGPFATCLAGQGLDVLPLQAGLQELLFSELKKAAVGETPSNPSAELGIIRVEFVKGSPTSPLKNHDFGPAKPVGSYKKFGSSTLKAYSHETIFEKAKLTRPPAVCEFVNHTSVQIMLFKYLSKELLQQKRIIEINESNSDLELEIVLLKQEVLREQKHMLQTTLKKLRSRRPRSGRRASNASERTASDGTDLLIPGEYSDVDEEV
ncbi:hypothetical protein P7C70_g3516, partial [Phenoliferia sp. Uapishka_3]